jgi:hypothetical protein
MAVAMQTAAGVYGVSITAACDAAAFRIYWRAVPGDDDNYVYAIAL